MKKDKRLNFEQWVIQIAKNGIKGEFECDILKSYHKDCEPDPKIKSIVGLMKNVRKVCFYNSISITMVNRCLPQIDKSVLTFPAYLFY